MAKQWTIESQGPDGAWTKHATKRAWRYKSEDHAQRDINHRATKRFLAGRPARPALADDEGPKMAEKFIDQKKLRGMHGKTLLQATKHFGHSGTNNREAWAHAYKASETHNNRYNNLAENKEGHADHTAQAAKLRAAGDEKGAKIHEELASHYHRAQGIEVPKKARAPRVTKDPLVQASKSRAAKAPEAGHAASHEPGESDVEHLEHAQEHARAAKEASAHAGTKQDGPSHKAAGEAHAKAAKTFRKAGDTNQAAAHEKLSELHHGEASKHGESAPKAKPSHAETMEGLHAKRAGIAAKTASAKEKTAASKARTAGMHAELGKVNAAKSAADEHNEGLKKKIGGLEHEVKKTEGAASKQEAANRKALRSSGEDDAHVPDHKLIGGAKEGEAKPKKPRAPRKSKDPLVQAAKGAKAAAPTAEGGDDKSKILAHMAKAPDDAHKFGDIKAATGMDHERFSKALQGLEASGHLVSYNSRDWNDAKGAAEAKKQGDEHGIHRGGVQEEHPRIQARLDQYHPEVKKLLAGGAAAKGERGSAAGAATKAALGTRVAGAKGRLEASRARVASGGAPIGERLQKHMAENPERYNAVKERVRAGMFKNDLRATTAVHDKRNAENTDAREKALKNPALQAHLAEESARRGERGIDHAEHFRNAGISGPDKKAPTAAATHAAETQARQAGLATSHGEAFGKLQGAYSTLAQHHEISARTATDPATKASHANLAAHYGNTRDFTARANAGERLKDSNAAEREHAGHAEAHRFAAKGAGHPSVAALHNNLAAHHDELHAHHVANRHGISLQDARKAVKDAGESLRKGGIRSRGEAHNFRSGKRGGWYFVNQHGVKVYAGKGHR